jgi:hypothetical protein
MIPSASFSSPGFWKGHVWSILEIPKILLLLVIPLLILFLLLLILLLLLPAAEWAGAGERGGL